VIGEDSQEFLEGCDLFLVDFQGGAYQSFRSAVSGNNKKEDVPAEVLILEPDGRLIASGRGVYLTQPRG
jgi:hypothetical protein